MLDGWLGSMVATSGDAERIRKSKDSANRVLTMVKALLNHVMSDPSNGLTDDNAWRLVKPFRDVAKPRGTRYTDGEVRRLVKAAGDAATANLITGAYLTGARYGELTEARFFSISTPMPRPCRSMSERPGIARSYCRRVRPIFSKSFLPDDLPTISSLCKATGAGGNVRTKQDLSRML